MDQAEPCGADLTVLIASPLAAYPDKASFVANGKLYEAYLDGSGVNVVPGANTVTKGQGPQRTKSYTVLVTRPAS